MEDEKAWGRELMEDNDREVKLVGIWLKGMEMRKKEDLEKNFDHQMYILLTNGQDVNFQSQPHTSH